MARSSERERYASGDMPITVGVQNWGNTFVDFDVEAKVRNALPDLIAVEDFAQRVAKDCPSGMTMGTTTARD